MKEKEILIETGRFIKTRNLIEQAMYITELAENDIQPLEGAGLTQAMLDECDTLRNELINLEGKQESAKDNVPLSSENVFDSITEAKNWIKKAKLKAKRAFRLKKEILKDFLAHQHIGRSVPSTIVVLIKLIELERKYNAELAAFGGGNCFADEGARILSSLQKADSAQELVMTKLPESTAALYHKQGLLYNKLKDINDIAGEAFIDDPLKARNYNMSILKRGGRTRMPAGASV